ncbi:hypothetical protein PPSQR21_032570 [Paenibacillus polymyxa SQR-21]|uniref:hypothetical protein n=1 Tax=Paenibacillus polymyxa TaxID=1406 RepID=UPI00042E3689|nr:hypothetical protein [Paenibacillus polymyxa]AHM66896.1 hypothetical protein PPSQR21_032570 [Paenibacillus polymyxa SQR-21]
MTKQTYREVKREANVGERIKIVNPQCAYGYGLGSEGVVVESYGDSGIFMELDGRRHGVFHREYVVLELVTTLDTDNALAEAFTQFIRDNADTIRAILGDVTKTEPTALTRAAVIERARADVAELTRKMRSSTANSDGNRTFNMLTSKPEFHINRNKRAVTVLVRGIYGNAILEKGIAKAAPDDVFHAEIGKAIALRRALGLTVPSEYTDAPKPDEPRAGAVVADEDGVISWSTILTEREAHLDGARHGKAWRHTHDCGWIGENQFVIIDDTDVDYSIVTEGAAA